MTTPRLHLYTANYNKQEELLGSFADGPKGRREAQEALREAHERDDALQNYIERDYSNPRHVPGSGHKYSGLLVEDVRVERVFKGGNRQPLLRIPGLEDARPQTMDEAIANEDKRVELWLRGRGIDCQSEPLTPAEAAAKRMAYKDPQRALLKAESMAAHRQSLVDAAMLQASTLKIDIPNPMGRPSSTGTVQCARQQQAGPKPNPMARPVIQAQAQAKPQQEDAHRARRL